jgi:RimJ/RimL family protein N-acetyltransferase
MTVALRPTEEADLDFAVALESGQDLGRASLTLVLDHTFDEFSAHRVWLDVKPDNARQ